MVKVETGGVIKGLTNGESGRKKIMKYAVIGFAIAAVLLAGLVLSGGAANAGDETRLRAFLSNQVDDPFRLNVADFRQRPDRAGFRTEVRNVAELGTGRVIVMRRSDIAPPAVILDAPIAIVLDPIRGTGVGHLEIDSRLGDNVPIMVAGDTVEVWNPLGQLIRTGTLDSK